ncbi:Homeobox domain-containing protein [Psidium guajava]|nr:Homeobox domain-containing protein [Psidium guajava]
MEPTLQIWQRYSLMVPSLDDEVEIPWMSRRDGPHCKLKTQQEKQLSKGRAQEDKAGHKDDRDSGKLGHSADDIAGGDS